MKQSGILTLTGKKDAQPTDSFSRRKFFRYSAMSVAGLALAPRLSSQEKVAEEKPKPSVSPVIKTNIDEVRSIPRVADSMPGEYPGRVVKINTGTASNRGTLDVPKVKAAVNRGLSELTGEKDIRDVWRQFVSPSDIVGIKVNPIGGKIFSTKPEVVDVILEGLQAAGVPKANIVIWDRRHFQLAEAGFTPERFPGIRILGTEMKGPNGDFWDPKDELWSKDNIDREALPYVAESEMKYDRETMPYMINEGKHSYFTRLVTDVCTKIINVPILKNAGLTVTACLKNLSYGSLSNTARLHALWMKSVAEPCAFPCLRDKVVLNIVDGLQACYDGGPGANPKFVYDSNVMLFGTDPVAVDAVGHDIIVKERMARGVQQIEDKKQSEFLYIAEALGLGVAAREKVKITDVSLT
ncbi:MAG: DUF362 domain-containing protein [Candidatus Aminicenantales bacterium]